MNESPLTQNSSLRNCIETRLTSYNLSMLTLADSTPNKSGLYSRQALGPILWLTMLYTATALTAGDDTTPDGSAALILFETGHVVIHFLAFAVQAWLVARALRLSDGFRSMRNRLWLVALVLVLGIGQEALQGLYRYELSVLASLWDLAVDTAGGAAGYWWYGHRRIRPSS